jgi:hypothetical protein
MDIAKSASIGTELGEAQVAQNDVAWAPGASRSRQPFQSSVVTLAVVRCSAAAQNLADEAVKKYPKDTFVNDVDIPVAEAEIAIQQHQSAKAIQLLQIAEP